MHPCGAILHHLIYVAMDNSSRPSQAGAAWKHLRFLLIAHIYSVPQTREHRLEHLRSGMQLKIFSYLCTVLHY